MTNKELNLKLINYLPEIKKSYENEVLWQDGDNTGSHVVYGDVFVPFIKEQLKENNDDSLKQIFEFVEKLLALNDKYTNEVIAFSVIESLLFDDEIEPPLIMKYVGLNTLKIIEEINVNLEDDR